MILGGNQVGGFAAGNKVRELKPGKVVLKDVDGHFECPATLVHTPLVGHHDLGAKF